MERRINVAALLKGCPKGFELYSPMYGVGKLVDVDVSDEFAPIIVDFGTPYLDENVGFMDDGRWCPEGEVMLFPSEKIRDWRCFHLYRYKKIMEEMKMFFEQIRKEEQNRSVMQEIEEIVDDFNHAIDEILDKLKEKK